MNTDSTLIGGLDPALAGRLASRRDLFAKAATKLGVVATAPVLFAAVSSQAFGQDMPAEVTAILNFALTLEYLEDEFYRTALGKSDLIPGEFKTVFSQISKHETEHVATLKGALGSAAVAQPKFDFTAGGKYADVFSNFKTFALLSQTFEETGVAAYKGQAPGLMSQGKVLTTALQIHSVEARHAAEVRRVREVELWPSAFDKPMTKEEVLAAVKPFIVG
jgi:rubrerythrin